MLAAGATDVQLGFMATQGNGLEALRRPASAKSKAPAKSTKPAPKQDATKPAPKQAPKSDAKPAKNPSKSTYTCVRFPDEKRNFCR